MQSDSLSSQNDKVKLGEGVSVADVSSPVSGSAESVSCGRSVSTIEGSQHKTIVDTGASVVGLQISGLGVSFGSKRFVLDGLNLTVQPGEIIALVGASGCGKSTLLRTVAGLIRPNSGSIQFFRNKVGPSLQTSLTEPPKSAFVFQDATLLPWRTVSENVRLPFELSGNSVTNHNAAEISKRVDRALNAVALGPEQRGLFPRQLSGGMKMRTSIARALVTEPELLLLDEPFAALDDILRSRLNQLLLDLWQTIPRTILFVTHNIAEAAMLSHKVAVIAEGKVARLIENDLAWPRALGHRSTVEFAQMYGKISQALTDTSPIHALGATQ